MAEINVKCYRCGKSIDLDTEDPILADYIYCSWKCFKNK